MIYCACPGQELLHTDPINIGLGADVLGYNVDVGAVMLVYPWLHFYCLTICHEHKSI